MQLIFFLVIVLRLVPTGSRETEYNSSNTAILHCIFPENSTRTDFVVYFYDENGKTELLVDCAWERDELECIQQEGFNCRLPVPNTAEIEVPQIFVTRPSQIGYTLNGDDPSKVNFCHFVENQSEGRKESQNKTQQINITENNYDHKASSDFPVWVIGLVIGAVLAVGVIVIGIVLYKKICRNFQTHKPEESDEESPSLVSTGNSKSDDNSSRSTVKDQFFPTQRSSRLVDEDRVSLNS
ncbi:uncharacterized protein LOC112567926 isoform X2 [Pomacea canaliculata]|uniref:uncharacterized protein LOC112567926 isoform X2 n=1 Tax=Pomacea canaliculata TaxID=400727 RepID=UPI000D73BFC0|nr:uncharacterized protein LOC112567926 isoform X2 [Pomacea canaliculata]